MARNRAAVDREQKKTEILDAATELFLTAGYEATPMSALASAAGVATNTLYWYFDDKDALLLAVVGRAIRDATERYEREGTGPVLADRLMWLVNVFDRHDSLISTIHSRAEVSDSVRGWHELFHERSDAWLQAEILAHWTAAGTAHCDAAQLAALARIWSYAIEGMIAHHLSDADRRTICAQLVRGLGSA